MFIVIKYQISIDCNKGHGNLLLFLLQIFFNVIHLYTNRYDSILRIFHSKGGNMKENWRKFRI